MITSLTASLSDDALIIHAVIYDKERMCMFLAVERTHGFFVRCLNHDDSVVMHARYMLTETLNGRYGL